MTLQFSIEYRTEWVLIHQNKVIPVCYGTRVYV